jgi:N6-adenosine-specific RNA methylase IME4
MHSKEFILVGKRGNPVTPRPFDTDIIFAPRTVQSAKPEELYEWIERLFPDGRFLDIFARMTSLRSGWVSIGNELDVANHMEQTCRSKTMVDKWMAEGHMK